MNSKIFLIILSLILLSACGTSWQTVSKSGFTVEMPGTPIEEPQSDSGMTGNSYTVETKDEAFTFNYTDYPTNASTADPEQILNMARNGGVRAVNGQLTSERSITLNGKPGKELVGDGTMPRDLTFVSRIYWDSSRLYVLVYIRPKGAPASENGEKFLNSLKLTAK